MCLGVLLQGENVFVFFILFEVVGFLLDFFKEVLMLVYSFYFGGCCYF